MPDDHDALDALDESQQPEESEKHQEQPPEPAQPAEVADGSRPMPDVTDEKRCNLVANGMSATYAIKTTAPKPVKYGTAKVQGSRWRNRPEISRRVDWLIQQKNRSKQHSTTGHGVQAPESAPAKKKATTTTPAAPAAGAPDPSAPRERGLTASGIVALLESLGNNAENEGTRLGALKLLHEIKTAAKTAVVMDPGTICDYLAEHAGDKPRLAQIVAAALTWCRAGLDDLRGVVAEMEREIAPDVPDHGARDSGALDNLDTTDSPTSTGAQPANATIVAPPFAQGNAPTI
jgi:hypothetical protein